MSKKEKSLNLVIDFLTNELHKIQNEIRNEQGNSNKRIEFKGQLSNAINLLKFCSKNGLYSIDFDLLRIPDKGSDAYFTEYIIVDEAEIDKISPSAIVKTSDNEVKLNWSDLIIKKK